MALSEQRGFVHVIDDNETFRKTIEGRLKQFGYEVSTCPSAQHLLDSLPGENVPSCILLDVRLPGTGYPDIRTTVRVIKGGGDDFLIKPISSDQLLQAVERAIAHHDAVLGLKKMREAVLSHLATLTPRERQVFELVIRGNSNKAIGNALGATERTIKAHRQSVMEKMQVRSLTELVSVAERIGILRDPPGSR